MLSLLHVAEYELSNRADRELRDLWQNIAIDNLNAADAWLLRILAKLDRAAEYPYIGAPRPALSAKARILVEGMYIIIYEPSDVGIFVLAVVYGARNPDDWLS